MNQEEIEKYMASLSDVDLERHIRFPKEYTADELEAAIIELQKRGKYFTDSQLLFFKGLIERKRTDEDPNTKSYYSQMAIWWFSILFSVLFGAVLLSANIPTRREKWIVIGFGITYLVFIFTVLSFIESEFETPISLLLNSIGGAILQTYFWNTYLGVGTNYRKKSMLIPILIALAITMPLIIISFLNIKH